MAIRTVSIGLAAVAAAVLALPASGEASHEHWFFDSYQAHEHRAYPYGYYRPVPSPYGRWAAPSPRYVPSPAYQAPRRWFPSAPPGYWFPPTQPPRQVRPSAPPSEVYETRRRVPPPTPRDKPEDLQTEVAAGAAPESDAGQRPADADIVTGTLSPVKPRPEQRTPQPNLAARNAPEPGPPPERGTPQPDMAAASAPEAAPQAERQAAAQPAGHISCEAAADIVGDFGFSDVRATQCDGQVYDFEATRDGQDYSIKLSAADGELTEVRRH